MQINGTTQIVGVFGYPIAHTLSPAMHNAAFRALGLNYVYLPFEVPPSLLQKAVEGLAPLGVRGVNLTIPHKELVLPYLDSLDAEAKLIGAVNTIVVKNGRLHGLNTDGAGFVRFLREELGVNPVGKRFAVLGAGGAARAIVASLALGGAGEIAVLNRTVSRAEKLCDDLKSATPNCVLKFSALDDAVAVANAQVLVNSTSVGLHQGDPSPITEQSLHEGLIVVDLIYNPPETALLKAARKRGLKAANGLGMLMYQGALAFEEWTGVRAPIKVMKEALLIGTEEENV